VIVQNLNNTAAGLVPYTDGNLVEKLRHLAATLKQWEWIEATSSAYDDSPEQVDLRVIHQLQAAAEAASACTVKAPATEATR